MRVGDYRNSQEMLDKIISNYCSMMGPEGITVTDSQGSYYIVMEHKQAHRDKEY